MSTESVHSPSRGPGLEVGVTAAVALLVIVGFPLLHASGYVSTFTISLWGKYLCYALLAISVNLLWGYLLLQFVVSG